MLVKQSCSLLVKLICYICYAFLFFLFLCMRYHIYANEDYQSSGVPRCRDPNFFKEKIMYFFRSAIMKIYNSTFCPLNPWIVGAFISSEMSKNSRAAIKHFLFAIGWERQGRWGRVKRGGKIGGPKREVWKGSAPKLNLFNGRKYFDDATEFV